MSELKNESSSKLPEVTQEKTDEKTVVPKEASKKGRKKGGSNSVKSKKELQDEIDNLNAELEEADQAYNFLQELHETLTVFLYGEDAIEDGDTIEEGEEEQEQN